MLTLYFTVYLAVTTVCCKAITVWSPGLGLVLSQLLCWHDGVLSWHRISLISYNLILAVCYNQLPQFFTRKMLQ